MNATLTRIGEMAKRTGRPKKPRGEGRLVRLDPAIVEMGKHVAAARGMALADYFADLLRAPVSRDFAKEMKRLQEEGKD